MGQGLNLNLVACLSREDGVSREPGDPGAGVGAERGINHVYCMAIYVHVDVGMSGISRESRSALR